MLLPLWPLFLMAATSAVDTPEMTVVRDDPEIVVVSVDAGLVVVKET